MVKGFKNRCETISLQMRSKLGFKNTDVLDPYLLAEYLNIKIISPRNIPGLTSETLEILLMSGSESWSAATLVANGKSLIIFNAANTDARTSSDLMHEISHILLGHRPSEISVTEDRMLMLNIFNSDQESEAAWLSGCLLLPRDTLILIKRNNWNSQIVRSMYKVSEQMLNYRLKVTGVDLQFSRFRRSYN